MLARTLAAFAILSSAATARADGDVGRACQTSAECGDLHCIDGACVAVENGRVIGSPGPQLTSGTKGMFGDGHGYAIPILVADLCAAAVTGTLVALEASTLQGGFAIAALFPTTLTAPIMHLAYGRPIPALISLLGWASVPPTALFFGALVSLGNRDTTTGGVLGFATGIGISLAVGTGLTALDVYFARPVHLRDEQPSFTWAPAIAPTPGGLTASIVGTF